MDELGALLYFTDDDAKCFEEIEGVLLKLGLDEL